MKTYDLIVLGCGAGGLTVAYTALGLGKKVLVIEKDKPGGECTWSGCIPSKALINLAKKQRYVAQPDAAGSAAHMQGVRRVIDSVYAHETPAVLQEAGLDYLRGAGRFVDRHTIEVDGQGYRAKKFVIATGSSPFVPPIPGLDTIDFLSNESVFKLDALPSSLVILGGGAIGVELAQAMNRLGVDVTLVEMQNQLMFREEPELAALIRQKLTDEGVRVLLNTRAVSVEPHERGMRLFIEALEAPGAQEVPMAIEAERLLVAVGRQPNVSGLGLEAIDMQMLEKGKGIAVDAYLHTSVAGIYACGDVAGPYLFSHMANYQGKIAAMNALLPWRKKADYRHVTWCTFTDPEFARAGLSESEARAQYGEGIRVYHYDFAALDRAKTNSGEIGRIKLILDRRGKVLGAHIVAERAGEMIAEVQVLKTLGIKFSQLQKVIHPYPSYADALRQLAQQVYLDELRNHPLLKLLQGLRALFRTAKA